MSNQAREIKKLSTLVDVGQALASTLNLKIALHKALEILEHYPGGIRGTVTLIDERTGQLYVKAANGQLPRDQPDNFSLGDEIIRQVIETGKTIVIPQVSREPLVIGKLSKIKSLKAQELSFIAVPITLSRKTIGALSIDLPFYKEHEFESTVKCLTVATSMIAQAMKIHNLIETERQRLMDENSHLKRELQERYDFSNIIGNSAAVRQVYEQVSHVARSNTTVLIRGESGTGKELIAQAIHYNSMRAKKPFIKVNCAALPDTLIESELFGYEKGAFTGAQARKKGRFEMAEGGTLFLDEIGDINLAMQVKLLRVLQEREFERLGGTETIKANVRIIAATNKNLEKAIEEGTFREDLFYRLNVFTVFVPALKERKSDILLLAEHFLEKYRDEHGKEIKRISTPSIDMLMSYHWPGNIRELENTIERAVLLCDGQVIHSHHLPVTLQTAETSGTVMTLSLEEAVASYEKDLIQDALKMVRGNRSKAAKLLKTTQRILNYKIKRHAIDMTRFRS